MVLDKVSREKKKKKKKNAKIAQSYKQTRERRQSQTCKVVELKVDSSRLNSGQRTVLPQLFLEAKWMYNEALAQEDINSYVPGKTVMVKTFTDEYEERNITYLSGQAKQGIVQGIKSSIKALKTAKDKGRKVGALKFTRRYDSIDYKQAGKSYKIDREKNTIKIQNIPGSLHVHGMQQITDDMEIANAKLVQRPSGYYLKVTVFIDKSNVVDDYVPGTMIGIDMGVSSHLTSSTGEKIKCVVPETPRLKRLQRQLDRQYKQAEKIQKQRGGKLNLSKNYFKTLDKLRLEYEKMDRKKDDLAHQICSRILVNEYVFYQDELLSAWKVRFGRQIHHSVLGRVKVILKRHDRAYMLDSSIATTQYCPKCGHNTKHALGVKIYVCSNCGHTSDRDIHAAGNMVILGSKDLTLPTDCGEVTPVPVCGDGYLCSLGIVLSSGSSFREDLRPLSLDNSSVKQETHPSSVDG